LYGKVSPFPSQNRVIATVMTILETPFVQATPFIIKKLSQMLRYCKYFILAGMLYSFFQS